MFQKGFHIFALGPFDYPIVFKRMAPLLLKEMDFLMYLEAKLGATGLCFSLEENLLP